MRASVKANDPSLYTPRQIFEQLDRYLIGQEKAKRIVSVAAYNHLKRCHARRSGWGRRVEKSNMLLMGPTGCGKTYLASKLAEILDVPFSVADVTEYTEAGYFGRDVESILADLFLQARQSIEETENGIVFIDEVDKIARRDHSTVVGSGNRDIGGEGVQQSLLKILEGSELNVPTSSNASWGKHELVTINTRDILFICAGTFSDLYSYKRVPKVGFNNSKIKSPSAKTTRNADLVQYGMLSEFLGRIPVVVEMEELNEQALCEILTRAPDSLLRQYQELLQFENITLSWSDVALQEVAHYAYQQHLGTRGLRVAFEELMGEILFYAPEHRGGSIYIDEQTVRLHLASLLTGIDR